VGEHHPRQSISVPELGTLHSAREHGQLSTERQILERDRPLSAADQRERSKRDDERSQHELSCPAINHRINRGGDLILANDRQRLLLARNIGEGHGRPSAILDGRFLRLGAKLNF
jgi:hypothetical protein